MPNTVDGGTASDRTTGMEAQVRETARHIRLLLESDGPVTLAALARRITNISANEISLAIGWLAHEGTVRLEDADGVWEVTLRESLGSGNGSHRLCGRMGKSEGCTLRDAGKESKQ